MQIWSNFQSVNSDIDAAISAETTGLWLVTAKETEIIQPLRIDDLKKRYPGGYAYHIDSAFPE
jgi:hypothetical protein